MADCVEDAYTRDNNALFGRVVVIGRLRGLLVEKRTPWLVVEMQNGVGYELEASMSTYCRLPEINQEVTLYTHQVVREDAHLLYGFIDLKERTLFRTLIKVNGIGPKLALVMLSSFEPAAFVACVNAGDAASLVRVPGVGKKTAERLIVEMKDRLPDEFADQTTAAASAAPTPAAAEQAISALISLGYKPQEASKRVASLDCDEWSVEQIIKAALQGAMA